VRLTKKIKYATRAVVENARHQSIPGWLLERIFGGPRRAGISESRGGAHCLAGSGEEVTVLGIVKFLDEMRRASRSKVYSAATAPPGSPSTSAGAPICR